MIARPPGRITRRRSRRRRGVILVESAIIYSVTLMLILGTIVMGLGVFRYGQIASLAREGSRWASVHGATWQAENQNAAARSDADVKAAIIGKAVILDASALTVDLDQTQMTSGVASVTVTYRWTPEAYFGALTMTSKSVMPVTY